MAANDHIQRVRIYLRERDRWEGQPLYTAVLNRLQQQGATGATALRGLAGFGPGYRVRTAAGGDLADDAPVVIEWVDRAERIHRLLPTLDDMLPSALTTLEDLRVYRAALRARGPFSDETTVGDVAMTDAITVNLDSLIGAAVYLMLGRDQDVLPVLNERGGIEGLISSSDLQRRAGLAVPLRLLRVLSSDERRPFIQPLATITARSCMTSDPRCINAMSGVLQALVGMLEWNYATLPVLDRDSHFVGLLTGERVLQAAARSATPSDSPVRDADPPTRIQLIMQIAVPQASVTQPLSVALGQLVAAPQRFLVLTDAAGRVRGTLSDVDALRGLGAEERAQFLAALMGEEVDLPGSDRSPETLAVQDFHTLTPEIGIEDAIQRFVSLGIERAPVVDEDGKLVGLIARNTLLRALAQAS